jgi:hypothetical protein
MSKIKSIFRKAWIAFTNPGQDDRVEILIKAIGKELTEKKTEFNLERVVESVECNERDVAAATKVYYERLLSHYWSKGVPPEEKRNLLVYLAKKLRLSGPEVDKMNKSAASIYFGVKMGLFLEDGVITDNELLELENISSAVGLSVSHFVQIHLMKEGLALLRGLFANAVEDGYLEPKVWDNLVHSASRLGLSEAHLQTAILPLAMDFTNHVLADAKCDNKFSIKQIKYLKWILDTFYFDEWYADDLKSTIKSLKDARKQEKLERDRVQKEILELETIKSGNLPTLDRPVGVNLKSGELLYIFETAIATFVSRKSGGSIPVEHHGQLMLTDYRLIFDSPTKSFMVPYRSIISWRATKDSVTVKVANKPEISFSITTCEEKYLSEKFHSILAMQSRTMTRRVEGGIDRSIPQDVRNRVWQVYGGKCAQCGSRDYLEFDHIIPVAKGGSNSEQNVQLLCRKCNLSKSDKI